MMIRVLAGLAALCAFAAPASAQDLPVCGTYPAGAASHSCACPAGFSKRSVWGSGPYTGDSDICTAALHSGMIPAEGGAVLATLTEGQSAYEGSTSNGVSTSRWGSFAQSLTFLPVVEEAAGGSLCTVLQPGPETRCTCPADGANRVIWGAGPYTGDSDLCTAARHAGAIGLAGGEISALRLPGLTAYSGTERNGIRSQDWGTFAESFTLNANN
jgi:hypothetical protein